MMVLAKGMDETNEILRRDRRKDRIKWMNGSEGVHERVDLDCCATWLKLCFVKKEWGLDHYCATCRLRLCG